MSKTQAYKPHSTSLAGRVCAFFARNDDEELTRTDIAQKFEINATSVEPSLMRALDAGLLIKAKGSELGLVVFKAGPNLPRVAPTEAPAPIVFRSPAK